MGFTNEYHKKKKESENEIKTEVNKETQNLEFKKEEFLKSKIFFGLKNLNDGFDAESIYYFSQSDFDIVLNRVEKNGIGIYGIEPWMNGDFYGVKVHEQINAEPNNPSWYREAFSEFKKSGKNLQYSATYQVRVELTLLNNFLSFRGYSTTFVETESSSLSDDLQYSLTHLNIEGTLL